EEYISSYLKLYESIYFHKTTRGIQFLVQHALSDALADVPKLKKRGLTNRLLDYFTEKPKDRLGHYLKLDDNDIIQLMKDLGAGKFGRATTFSKRFLERKPLRCYEPNDPNHDPDMSRTNLLRERLKEAKIWFHMDIAKPKGFKQYDVMDDN